MKVLGIESSCDETAAAIVEDGKYILSNVIATQIPFHQVYNGVVPEIASRKHAEWILPVVRQALDEAHLTMNDVDAVAATNRPGLMGALLMGLTFGKTLAWSLNKPFIAVNHMRRTLCFLARTTSWPALSIRIWDFLFQAATVSSAKSTISTISRLWERR